jgi:hypothetical protein
MAAKKGATVTPIASGKRWKRIERKRFRFWRPDDDSTPLVGRLISREEKNGRFGIQPIYTFELTENATDRKGDLVAGDIVALREYATLRDLVNLVGKEVRITPAGLDGRVVLFDVDVAD